MTRVLLLAVVMAQAVDLATWMAMPGLAEVNPLARALHTEQGWLAKAVVVSLVLGVDVAVRNAPTPKYAWVAALGRASAELVAVLAIAVGCIGAGSNLAVLSVHAAEAPRSVQEPIPIASDATGIEQGPLEPAAPGRTPAPSGVGLPPQPVVATVNPSATRRAIAPGSVPAPIVPRGTTH